MLNTFKYFALFMSHQFCLVFRSLCDIIIIILIFKMGLFSSDRAELNPTWKEGPEVYLETRKSYRVEYGLF